METESLAQLTFLRKSMWVERSVRGVAENRVSGSEAVSGRPRSGSGAESGCHKNRLEGWAGNQPLTLRSHALLTIGIQAGTFRVHSTYRTCFVHSFHAGYKKSKLWNAISLLNPSNTSKKYGLTKTNQVHVCIQLTMSILIFILAVLSCICHPRPSWSNRTWRSCPTWHANMSHCQVQFHSQCPLTSTVNRHTL